MPRLLNAAGTTLLLEPQRDIFSVTRLNREVAELLELTLGWVWVEGELSNLARPASGHLYFSLKDSRAQVRCALFKQKARLLQTTLENGQQVRLRARVALYQPRGDYQLIVEHVEDIGAGALQRKFEEIKAKLNAEGLFEPDRKKPLPPTPQTIGVITSASGAAVRDVVHVLARRYPMAKVLVFPTLVQGPQAPGDVARAIARADGQGECDVLLLVRGGGSLEDLWAFNEEAVARAVVACQTPIVSGVGHEIDTTIVDYVADARAPTPSAAAEMVSPDIEAMRRGLAATEQRLRNHGRRWRADLQQRTGSLLRRLQLCHPQRQLEQQQQHLDNAEARLFGVFERLRQGHESALGQQLARLAMQSPRQRIARDTQRRENLQLRLERAMHVNLQQASQRLSSNARALDTVSPLATLDRGYAVVRRTKSGEVISKTAQLNVGEAVEISLRDGKATTRVEALESAPVIHSDDTPAADQT